MYDRVCCTQYVCISVYVCIIQVCNYKYEVGGRVSTGQKNGEGWDGKMEKKTMSSEAQGPLHFGPVLFGQRDCTLLTCEEATV